MTEQNLTSISSADDLLTQSDESSQDKSEASTNLSGLSYSGSDFFFTGGSAAISAQAPETFHNSVATVSDSGISLMTCNCPQCLASDSGAPLNAPTSQNFTLSSEPNYEQALFGDGNTWTGTKGQAVTIQYALNSTFADHPLGSGVNLSAAQQTAVREILGIWSTYANITFQEVSASSALLKFKNYDLPSGVGGVAYTWTYNGVDQIAKSVVSVDIAVTGFNQNDYGYLAYIHEIGHSLGLKHPGNYNAGGGGAESPYLTDFGLTDSRDYTVMSYYNGSYSDEPSSAMIYDIATIQTLYGANTSYNSTNTTYSLNGNAKVWTIWDGGGTDTIDSSSYSSNVTIDLREGAANASHVGSNNFWIAFGANIENVTTGSGNDTISGNSLGNTITSGAGNDVINGYGGTDIAIYAGTYANYTINIVNATTLTIVDNYLADGNDGTDTLISVEQITFGGVSYGFDGTSIRQLGMDTIGGATAGNDVIYGTDNNNMIQGLGGNDKLLGRGGDDSILGGDGNDGILGEAGYDTINGEAGSDDIYGGDGNDSILGGIGNDILRGELGADNIDGGVGLDTIYGGDGNDTIAGGLDDVSDSADKIFGGIGDDSIRGGGGNDGINGDDGNDSIYGESGNDDLYGGNGIDYMLGGTGNDSLHGGVGNDLLYGDANNDIIWGEAGDDYIEGNTGADTIYGGDANDTIIGGLDDVSDSADKILGGNGNDSILGGGGTDGLNGEAGNDIIYGNSGNDIIYGGAGFDTIYGGSENDIIYGQDDADTVYGETGNDTIYGDNGNDILYGDAGGDKIYGGSGNDTIYGGGAADYLSGGLGADTFVFTATSDATTSGAYELIGDFSRAQGDRIDLSALAGTMSFIGNTAYTGAGNQIQYKFDGAYTTVRIDSDGNRLHDMIFQLAGNIALQSSDFIL